MSSRSTRRGSVKANAYENSMDRLDHAPSKPPIAAWDGEEARRIVQKLFDPGTDATKLFEKLTTAPDQQPTGDAPVPHCEP